MIERKRHGRKLLIASIGVAAVSYVACGGDTTNSTGGGSAGSDNAGGSANSGGTGGGANTGGTSGGNTGGNVNTGGNIAVGNLMPYPVDASTDTSAPTDATSETPVGIDRSPIIGNLIAPPPLPDGSDLDHLVVGNLIGPPPPDAKDDTK